MKSIQIGRGAFAASEIALGCMRIAGLGPQEAARLIGTALDCGIDYFDHADIYGGGRSEEVFAGALASLPGARGKIRIQSKCGIRKGLFDFSREHIIASVEGSLRRLGTDHLDALLLHRPDTLMEPEEVADAFTELEQSGKVLHFGVSNQNPVQMQLLAGAVRQPLIINQLQFSIMHTGMIDSGINVNMKSDGAADRDGGILDYCRLKGVTIQPWSPFMYGFFEGVFLGNDKFPELNQKLAALAEKHAVPDTAIAIAWILRHPAKMQPVVGTTNPERLKDICRASDICLTREEWYAVYRAAGNVLP